MRVDPSSKVRLWVVSPRHVKRLAKGLSKESMEWCYLGTDISKREKVSQVLSHSKRVGVAEDLNRVAYEIKQPFLDWISEIGACQKDKLHWWASRIASKSTLQTDFFLLVSYHKLFRLWVIGGHQVGPRIVIVEDAWLRALLKRDFAGIPGVAFHGSKVDLVVDAAYWVARAPLATSYVILLSLWRRFVAGLVLQKARHAGQPALPGKPWVFLYTWIEPSCFVSPGKLTDVYTGRLEDILTKNGEASVRLASFPVPARFLRRLRGCAQHLIVTLQFATFRDIFRSALSWFRVDGLRELPRLDGGDYTSLFYREVLREWGAPGFAMNRLAYLAFRRVARCHKALAKGLIYPFENQPWEKMLCLAFREEAPGVKIIGYQHASIPSLLLCYFLGKHEWEITPLPDVIVTNGKATLNQLRNGGFPENKLVVGGAFRFEHLLKAYESNGSRAKAGPGESCILVAFPISRPHAVSLLRDLLELFPDPYLDAEKKRPAVFMLKCHPDLPWEMLEGEAPRLPAWFTISKQPLSVLIDTVDLFLYSPPTGTWREAYLAGLPVLKYRAEFLDVDSTDVLSREELPVCSRETLKEYLLSLLTSTSRSSREARRRFLEKVFSPVNEQEWLRLISGPRVS